jgi:hypothetical protein
MYPREHTRANRREENFKGAKFALAGGPLEEGLTHDEIPDGSSELTPPGLSTRVRGGDDIPAVSKEPHH